MNKKDDKKTKLIQEKCNTVRERAEKKKTLVGFGEFK